MKLTRRDALRGMLAGGALVAVPGAARALIPEGPRRRVWQVGTQLARPTLEETQRYGRGLVPVMGEPGMFEDLATGQKICMRDFREEDKYETVYWDPEERLIKTAPQEKSDITFKPGVWDDAHWKHLPLTMVATLAVASIKGIK